MLADRTAVEEEETCERVRFYSSTRGERCESMSHEGLFLNAAFQEVSLVPLLVVFTIGRSTVNHIPEGPPTFLMTFKYACNHFCDSLVPLTVWLWWVGGNCIRKVVLVANLQSHPGNKGCEFILQTKDYMIVLKLEPSNLQQQF